MGQQMFWVDGNVGKAVCSVTCLSLYIICYCHCLLSLLSLLSALCGKMWVVFSEGLNTLGPRESARPKHRDLLMNFLFGRAQRATWLTGRNRLQGSGLVDPELLALFTAVHQLSSFSSSPSFSSKAAFLEWKILFPLSSPLNWLIHV